MVTVIVLVVPATARRRPRIAAIYLAIACSAGWAGVTCLFAAQWMTGNPCGFC